MRLQVPVRRPAHQETTSLGAAFAAGEHCTLCTAPSALPQSQVRDCTLQGSALHSPAVHSTSAESYFIQLEQSVQLFSPAVRENLHLAIHCINCAERSCCAPTSFAGGKLLQICLEFGFSHD